jgi:hypothetical protein
MEVCFIRNSGMHGCALRLSVGESVHLLDAFARRALTGRLRTGGFFGIGGSVFCFALKVSNNSCLRSDCVYQGFFIFSQPLTVAYVPVLRFATTPSRFNLQTSLNKSIPRPSTNFPQITSGRPLFSIRARSFSFRSTNGAVSGPYRSDKANRTHRKWDTLDGKAAH